jgi:transcription termination/antitermination protein NusG
VTDLEHNRWYAIQTRPRIEADVHHRLKQREYETFFPQILEKRSWSDRVKAIAVPAFPGYVFIRYNRSNRQTILAVPGVSAIVSFGHRPAPVDNAEIESLRILFTSKQPVFSSQFIRCGEKVRVCGGLLDGVTGTLVRREGRQYVAVSVTLLNSSVIVKVEEDQIRPFTEFAC